MLDTGHLWAIVLAGGEGRRLAPLTRHLYGEERPKQFAALIGSRSLLEQTLARVALLIPPERTVVVTMARHAKYLGVGLARFPDVHVLAQPADRGTAAGVLLPAQWIRARDPLATVVVFPADHFVVEEPAFMRHVASLALHVMVYPQWLILLGAVPTGPEGDYGWIEPGEIVGWSAAGPLHRVRRFREKPGAALADVLFATGGLWSTLVFATSADTLVETGRRCLPQMYERLTAWGAPLGTQDDAGELGQAYRLAPTADFSRDVLEAPSSSVAVLRVSGLTWCDLGTPERVAWVLRSLGAPSPARRVAGAGR